LQFDASEDVLYPAIACGRNLVIEIEKASPLFEA
jgi:hypothetical protein